MVSRLKKQETRVLRETLSTLTRAGWAGLHTATASPSCAFRKLVVSVGHAGRGLAQSGLSSCGSALDFVFPPKAADHASSPDRAATCSCAVYRPFLALPCHGGPAALAQALQPALEPGAALGSGPLGELGPRPQRDGRCCFAASLLLPAGPLRGRPVVRACFRNPVSCSGSPRPYCACRPWSNI